MPSFFLKVTKLKLWGKDTLNLRYFLQRGKRSDHCFMENQCIDDVDGLRNSSIQHLYNVPIGAKDLNSKMRFKEYYTFSFCSLLLTGALRIGDSFDVDNQNKDGSLEVQPETTTTTNHQAFRPKLGNSIFNVCFSPPSPGLSVVTTVTLP